MWVWSQFHTGFYGICTNQYFDTRANPAKIVHDRPVILHSAYTRIFPKFKYVFILIKISICKFFTDFNSVHYFA